MTENPSHQTEETPTNWSAAGFKRDQVRDRIRRRRERVAEWAKAGYGAKIISRETGVSISTVQGDLRYLRDENLIDLKRKRSKPFKPTAETIRFMGDLLRQNLTYAEIGEKIGYSSATVSKFMAGTTDPHILNAKRFRASLRKKKEGPKKLTLSMRDSTRFREEMGCSVVAWSDANMLYTYNLMDEGGIPSSFNKRARALQRSGFTAPPEWVEYWEKRDNP